MGYLCGIGPGMRSLGLEPREPQVTCDADGCTARVVISDDQPPPRWLLNGKAPKGWRRVPRKDVAALYYCPKCLEKP